jgi:hypothetical protein
MPVAAAVISSSGGPPVILITTTTPSCKQLGAINALSSYCRMFVPYETFTVQPLGSAVSMLQITRRRPAPCCTAPGCRPGTVVVDLTQLISV